MPEKQDPHAEFFNKMIEELGRVNPQGIRIPGKPLSPKQALILLGLFLFVLLICGLVVLLQ
jgi:hypothetical protein